MEKKLISLFLALAATLTVCAHPVSEADARRKAVSFLQGRHIAGTGVERAKAPSATPMESAPIYIYNVEDEGGFVIISGDDATVDVLGYSTKGHMDYDRLPDNVRCIVDGYIEQIRLLRQQGAETAQQPLRAHSTTIAPMLTSTWNQNSPFNEACPIFLTGARSVTGCVATAFAQLLYYHRHNSVKETQAEITAYDCYRNWGSYVHVDAIAAGSYIDWDNMLDNYFGDYSMINKMAVANLMRYCGAAVRMDYADDFNGGSSATNISIVSAAKKYFGYRRDAAIRYHDQMTDEDWDDMLYRELRAGRPVIMDGKTPDNVGHAFICDGYDSSNGMYHINWGWGSYCDGYFVLTNLEPQGQGIGGTAGGYNSGQSALINMEPGDGTPYNEPLVLTTVYLKLTGDLTTTRNTAGQSLMAYEFMVANGTTDTHDFELALAAFDKNNKFVDLVTGQFRINGFRMNSYSQPKGSCYPGMTRQGNKKWANGVYTIRPVSRVAGSDEWLLNEGDENLYIVAEVSSNSITYRVGPEPNLDGIESISAEPATRPAGTYTLQGRKVTNGGKGIYIVNGRKVLR